MSLSSGINEIAGVTIEHKKKKHTPKSNASSPNDVSINQNQTQFCVACTSARVITYAIVRDSPIRLDDLDMLLLISFYIYRQTHNGERRLADVNKAISYRWLQLFVNEINANQILLFETESTNPVLHMGIVPYVNPNLFNQGDDPAMGQVYEGAELAKNNIDIRRLHDILDHCCNQISLLHKKLVLKTIISPRLEDFNEINCNKSMIGLAGDDANWDKIERPARDKNITFGPNNARAHMSGHEVFVYELKEMVVRKTVRKRLSIVNSWDNGGAIANKFLYYDLTPNSIERIVDDITWVEEEEDITARGIKTRRHKRRPTKTRNAKSRRHRRK
jgi:hypothetical protein